MMVANCSREAWPYRMGAGRGMSGERSGGTQAPSLERVQEVRLLALLHEARTEEAEVTLVTLGAGSGEPSGQLSR